MGFVTFTLYLLYSQKVYDYPILFFFQVPVDLCLGPLLYFYVESLTGDKDRLQRNDILHFIPLLVVTLYLISYFLYTPNVQREIIYELVNQNKHIMLRVIFTASVFYPVIYIAAPMVRIVLQLKKGNPSEKKIVLLLSSLILWVITGIVGIGGTIALSLSGPEDHQPPGQHGNIMFLSPELSGIPICVQYGTVHVSNESYSKSHLNGLDLDNLGQPA